MLRELWNRTSAARLVESVAALGERPLRPSMPAAEGVTSYCAVKEPVCLVNAVFTQLEEAERQTGVEDGVMLMTAEPLWPPAVAVIVTGPPSARSVTRPVLLTVATDGALLVQVKL